MTRQENPRSSATPFSNTGSTLQPGSRPGSEIRHLLGILVLHLKRVPCRVRQNVRAFHSFIVIPKLTQITNPILNLGLVVLLSCPISLLLPPPNRTTLLLQHLLCSHLLVPNLHKQKQHSILTCKFSRIFTITLNAVLTFSINSPEKHPGLQKTRSPPQQVEEDHPALPCSENRTSKRLRRSSSTSQLALQLHTAHPTRRLSPQTASWLATQHGKTRSGFRRRTLRSDPTSFRFRSV